MAQINKPTDYFNTKLYTGNGTTGHAITGVGFQPDWLWIKERSSTSSHFIYDAIRGVNVKLSSNTSDADSTVADSMTSFDSDGFTVGNNGATNENGQTVASWNFKANGTGSANTDGSTNTTVSANTTSGFSIVKWTGNGSATTLGHGLGSVPQVVFVKTLDRAENWVVYHVGNDATAPEDKSLRLDGTNAVQDNNTHFNDTAPTSSVFSVGASNGVNPSGEEIIAYCFAEKTGYSKFGSYVGTGNASESPFIYTGFSPSFVLIKEITNANNWMIYDNKRSPFNVVDDFISPDISDAETTGNANNSMDMLSNGFKLKGTGSATNRSGSTFVFMAFAAEPLVGTNNITATAR